MADAAAQMGNVLEIQQGAQILRALGCASSLLSILRAAFKLIDPTNAIFHPVMYLTCLYVLTFSISTLIFEAKPAWIQRIDFADKYQELLIKHCEFLAFMAGRGLFYMFQGTLWLSLCEAGLKFEFLLALTLIAVGCAHVLAHFGVLNHQVATKTKIRHELIVTSPQGSSLPIEFARASQP
eukprot:TRINITY_DN89756_c0_g1_i1.p1 TRINITY_DN89756_c0_g1~~TRINITY_DN89756_c0_g1_i1.p1  ORF type:complete len:200 (+),score=23.96 TRINITY_DN89756_c0_g1_i1:60-602(+)